MKAENFLNFQAINLSSANPKNNKFKENQPYAHHSKTADEQRWKREDHEGSQKKVGKEEKKEQEKLV